MNQILSKITPWIILKKISLQECTPVVFKPFLCNSEMRVGVQCKQSASWFNLPEKTSGRSHMINLNECINLHVFTMNAFSLCCEILKIVFKILNNSVLKLQSFVLLSRGEGINLTMLNCSYRCCAHLDFGFHESCSRGGNYNPTAASCRWVVPGE